MVDGLDRVPYRMRPEPCRIPTDLNTGANLEPPLRGPPRTFLGLFERTFQTYPSIASLSLILCGWIGLHSMEKERKEYESYQADSRGHSIYFWEHISFGGASDGDE